jgi:hypothetical protein
MPRKPRPGTTPVLAQVPNDIHAKADVRRRRERATWNVVIATLLSRWGRGDDGAVAKPVKVGRPTTPEAAELERFVAEWMKDPAYRKAATERVDITKLTRYRSLGELLAAGAAKAGRLYRPWCSLVSKTTETRLAYLKA